MTVNTSDITSGPYTGTGTTDTYNYDFRITDKSQIRVFETTDAGVKSELTVDTDFTVSGIGDDAGGQITRVAGNLPTDYTWYIRSDYQSTQESAFRSQGGFFPDVHEDALDKLTFLVQQIEDRLLRSFRLSDEIDIDGTFVFEQNAATRASNLLGFDASGNLIVVEGDTGSVSVTPFAATLLDDSNADAFWTTLNAGLSAAITLSQTLNAAADVNVTGDVNVTSNVNISKNLKQKFGSNVASASALSLGDGNIFNITGTTTITSIGTKGVGNVVFLRFDDVLTLTHNATDLILPGGNNIITKAGDWGIFVEYATGDWYCIAHQQYTTPLSRVGDIVARPVGTVRTGELECDGSLISMRTYENLYDVIGNDYGLNTGVNFTADAGTDIITSAGHGRSTGDIIEVTNSGGALPGGLAADTKYYIINPTTDTFQVSLTSGGSAVDITGAGTGTHSYHTQFAVPDYQGEFLRGWDNGAGNDPDAASRTDRGDGTTGDNVGTKQGHEYESHSHGVTQTNDGTRAGSFSQVSVSTGSTQTSSSGGNETRPRNVYVMWTIIYEG